MNNLEMTQTNYSTMFSPKTTCSVYDMIEHKLTTENFGKQFGHTHHTQAQIEIAIACEIGEVLQEVKSVWAWWKKPGDAGSVNITKLVDELADVLHFYCLGLYEQIYKLEQSEIDELKLPIVAFPIKVDDTLNLQKAVIFLVSVCDGKLQYHYKASAAVNAIFDFAATFLINEQTLIDAYFAKGRTNVDRWQKAFAQPKQYQTRLI